MGEKLRKIRRQIEEQKLIVSQQCDKLTNLTRIDEKIKENTEKQQDAEFRLKIFKDNGIEDKLKKQTDFDKDHRKIQAILADSNNYENALTEVVDQYEDELKNHLVYHSKNNENFFKAFMTLFQTELNSFETIKIELEKIRYQVVELKEKETFFSGLKKNRLINLQKFVVIWQPI
ncbi:MAG: hypothetical protein D3903_16430 [Candidatus Electrothrix sp. GM3_4]|nr:hypothetical protein [Candidatus Electrothrix sp. GM3_4]